MITPMLNTGMKKKSTLSTLQVKHILLTDR